MPKIKIDKNIFGFPMPVVLIGTEVNGKANFFTVAWVMKFDYAPAKIGFISGKEHYSNQGIIKNKTFSVNLPSQKQVKQTDYCGIYSGKKTDKSKVFEIEQGSLKGTPMIKGAPVCLECRLEKTIDVDGDYLFVGKVINAYGEKSCFTKCKPNMNKIAPFMYTSPDNQYWSLGKPIAKAWDIGKI